MKLNIPLARGQGPDIRYYIFYHHTYVTFMSLSSHIVTNSRRNGSNFCANATSKSSLKASKQTMSHLKEGEMNEWRKGSLMIDTWHGMTACVS